MTYPAVGPLTQAQLLAREASAAAEVRDWQTHPDVVALRVERVRTVVDRLIWTGMVAGLLFTMANVQQFAAAGAAVGSAKWVIAWLLDPTVSLVLLGVLFAERVTSREQITAGPWTQTGKWALLGATYAMNTWASWASADPAGVLLHSVPPLVVFVAAQAITELQEKLTECVYRAHAAAARRAEEKANAERSRAERLAFEDATRRRQAELDQLRHDAAVTAERAPIEAVAPAVELAAAPAVVTAATATRRPRVPTGKATGKDRGRAPALDLAVLVRHARPILDREPDLGRRELANRLSAAVAVDVPPYWAQKAKTEVEKGRPLHAVPGGDR